MHLSDILKGLPKGSFLLVVFSFPFLSNAQQGMGVGNTNPQEMLDVSGAIKIGTDFNNSNVAPTGGAGTIRFRSGQFEGWDGSSWVPLGSGADADWTVSGNDIYNANSGNVGVGTTNATESLTISGSQTATYPSLGLRSGNGNSSTNNGAQIAFGYNGTNTYQHFIQTRHNANTNENNAIDIFVSDGTANNTVTNGSLLTMSLNGGNVGIGTQSPQERLQIQGSIRMIDGNQSAGYIPVSDANGTMVWTDPATITTAPTSNDELIDADNDTKVQVEESADEDIIRFDVAGVEVAQLANGVSEIEVLSGFSQPTGLLKLEEYGLLLKGDGTNGGQVLTIEGQLPGGAFPFGRIDFRNTDNSQYTGASIRSYNGGNSDDGNLRFLTASNGTLSDAMIIDHLGFVGVGTTTPSEQLHVQGSIRMVDGNQAAGYVPVSDANGTMVWTDPNTLSDGDWIVSGNNIYNGNTGNVGLGDATPKWPTTVSSANALFSATDVIDPDLYALTVTRPNGTNNQGIGIGFGGSNSGDHAGAGIAFKKTGNNSLGDLMLTVKSDGSSFGPHFPALTVRSVSGNVGIGTTTPSEQLHIEGSIRMVDGNQTTGYIPVSDANGTMVWTDPATVTAAPIDELVDSDNDTKIQVEETADEDVIRFDMAGTEHFTMEGSRLSVKNSGQSVFIGESAGLADDLTNGSTFIGYEAGMSNITGFHSTAIGLGASRSTNADENTSVGAFALYANQTGIRNTIVGTAAGQSILGSRNTILGAFAGNNSTGSQNVFLGYLAGANETGDQKLYIENTTSASPLIYGEFDNDILGINGNLGVGTQSPQEELHVEGSIRMVDGDQAVGYIPVSDASGTMVWTDPLTISSGGWTISGNDIFSANSGNVGVGTASPVTKLDVDGGGWFRTASGGLASSANNGVRVFHDAVNDAGMIFAYDYSSGAANNLVLQQPGGNVGIGISTPSSKLHVSGDGFFEDDLTSLGNVMLENTDGSGTNNPPFRLDGWLDRLYIVAEGGPNGPTNGTEIRFRTSNGGSATDRMTLDNVGNLGIGTTDPTQKLHVEGSIRMVDGNQATGRVPVSNANGTMTWTDRSDFIAYHKQTGVLAVTNGNSTAYQNVAGLTSTTLSVQSGDIITLRAEAVVRCTSGSGNDDFYMRVSYGNCASGSSEEKIIRFDEDGGHDNFTTLNYMDVITAPCTGTLWFRFQIKHVGDDPWEAIDGIIVAEKY